MKDTIAGEVVAQKALKIVQEPAIELVVQVARIRPFKGQPRKDFDEVELKEIANSMLAGGQQVPVNVRRIEGDPDHDYELIDGESRYWACINEGIPTILVRIKEVKSDFDQFIQSLASNMCRRSLKSIETAFAIKEAIEGFMREEKMDQKEAIQKVKAICGITSDAWVTQHLQLLDLEPEVQELLRKKLISFQIGVALSSYLPESQIQYARYVIENNLSKSKALSYIRANRLKNLSSSGIKRDPYDDYRIAKRFFKNLSNNSDMMLSLPIGSFKKIYMKRPPEEIEKVIEAIREEIIALAQLRVEFKDILKARTQSK